MKIQRDHELTRLYAAAGLAVLVWMIFKAYKLLSERVSGAIDAPSKWALMSLGLLNVLAIGILLFIVARSLAKLYFERRRGILGARLRTRLVLAFFGVTLVPSLILFFVGQNAISKNLDRWFLPETKEIVEDGQATAKAFNAQVQARLNTAIAHVRGSDLRDLDRLRTEEGLDLIQAGDRSSIPETIKRPIFSASAGGSMTVESEDGRWLLRTAGEANGRTGDQLVVGIFVPRTVADGLLRMEKRSAESFQVSKNRGVLETLPQSTFLFLTVLTLFAAVWTGLTIARTLSEPIRSLAKAAKAVGTGDLEVQLNEEGEDELAFLAQTFNRMTSDLKSNRGAIEAQSARLDQQRAYLGQLLEALPVGVLSWDQAGQLRLVNPAARRWLGLEAFDPDRDSWAEWATQQRFGHLLHLLKQTRESGRAHQEELRLGGEGEGRLVRAILAPLEGGGALAVLEDLSLLAKAEKRAAWQEVARRMAHEVKNPLTPIKLTAQRLLRRVRENRLDPEVVNQGAETILTEVASLARLVDAFSRFARLPAPHPSDVDACDLLRQTATLYGPTHPKILWDWELPDHAVPVRWDGDMVKRAIINLVDNAVAAVEDAGTIRVGLMDRNGTVRIQVEDDGPGVQESHRERLFEPSFSTKERGSGLGLAIVRKIATDHGGEAFFEPLPKGSRFSVELPKGMGA
ncbi:MAG: HAMP domain-containing protein [Holophagaceae bacterium]|nr:HAMP domain-containing protein [Holophagaceae bacterium]